MDKDQKKIMLLLTEECNLNCVYCYEEFKSPGKMTPSTAKKILDEFYKGTNSGDTVLIEVFGGEPFINFDLIKWIDAYVQDTYSDRRTFFETTTNGTLVQAAAGDVRDALYLYLVNKAQYGAHIYAGGL